MRQLLLIKPELSIKLAGRLKQGLTLIEVIISSLILALTVGGVLLVFSTEKGVVESTGRNIQAMNLCRQTLEDLKNEVDASTWPGAGRLAAGGPFADAPPPCDLVNKFGGTREYTVTNIDANVNGAFEEDEYKRVTVTVDWNEP